MMNIPWSLGQLFSTPAACPADDFSEDSVSALYYDGVDWRGQPTRVFAWLGLPAHQPGVRAPGMVLVHGGGGTAFADWVRLWTARGYAAIAMDTCGCVPRGEYGNWQRHAHGGPPGWGGYEQVDEPVMDQWPYQAVADVILAHSLLRAQPQVDAERIGITGISWGGYLTCLAAGVDTRFRLAAPVYGCGFLGEDSCWLPDFAQMGEERATRWLSRWDPSVYLPSVAVPMLWVTGTNDFAYPMTSLRKSYRLPSTPRTLAIRVNMTHAHGGPGENPEEIHAFANALFRDGAPLAAITGQGAAGTDAWVMYQTAIPMARAEFNYTCDSGPWPQRQWQTVEAYLDATHATAHAAIPAAATAYYFNLLDERDLLVSSEHVEGSAS